MLTHELVRLSDSVSSADARHQRSTSHSPADKDVGSGDLSTKDFTASSVPDPNWVSRSEDDTGNRILQPIEDSSFLPSISPEVPRSTPYTLQDQQPLWPLKKKEEAYLLQYFSTDLALWFDYCDKENHFSTIVIPAAATSPTLLNAILAVSACHLSIIQGFDRYEADKYQRKCLKTLIPALASPEALLDDRLFAATVILRLFNEMTGRPQLVFTMSPAATKKS